ncbi:MAG TPA: hypothetical protein VGV10_03675 [Thermoleophilaceae bacterium]|nr:hypothetical protein [Thermoleophilaceae bacterium]
MLQLTPPQGAAAGGGELLLDLFAAGIARVATLDQPGSCAKHEPLHLGHLAAQHLGHVGVREAAELGEHERGALVVRQLLQVGHELAQVGALLHLIAESFGACVQGLFRLLAARPPDRDAAVARNGVEPRLEADLAVLAQKVLMGCCEGVLNGVLALVEGAEHVPAEREDAWYVAFIDGLERRLVPAPDLPDQMVVGT